MKRLLNVKFILLAIILLASVLRIYKLSTNPPSLFGDELDLGYQAYSILKTGQDYQGNFMPLNFHSIAEWRTPLYLYSAVPTVAIFGVTALGVRLPAAIFGILSVWLIYLVTKAVLSYKSSSKNAETVALVAAFLMSISPWSLQYSRAGFEVTEMLTFLLLGVYLFIKSVSNSKWLWLSVFFFVATPWVYSTAKLFTPLLMIVFFVLFKKEIFVIKKSDLMKAILIGLVIGLPLIYGTLFKGGTQRIGDISVLKDPNMEQVVGVGRDLDNKVGFPGVLSRAINNKYTYWGDKVINNYLESFSSEFLLIKGDLNLRQSIGWGEIYLVEILPLLIGIAVFFFNKSINSKVKILLATWFLLAPVPASLTLNGGGHATRLILLLPLYIFFISIGWVYLYDLLANKYKRVFLIVVSSLYLVTLIFYFHAYYVTYPVESAVWWHYGWEAGIKEVKSIDKNYDRVIISMRGEPAWVFFAGYYQYDPSNWQKNFPIGKDVELPGFGKVSHIDKFYFGSPEGSVQIYGLGRYIDSKTLYLANAKEDGDNLALNPEKTPPGLKLIKVVTLPNGSPSMYLFSGTK